MKPGLTPKMAINIFFKILKDNKEISQKHNKSNQI